MVLCDVTILCPTIILTYMYIKYNVQLQNSQRYKNFSNFVVWSIDADGLKAFLGYFTVRWTYYLRTKFIIKNIINKLNVLEHLLFTISKEIQQY